MINISISDSDEYFEKLFKNAVSNIRNSVHTI